MHGIKDFVRIITYIGKVAKFQFPYVTDHCGGCPLAMFHQRIL